MTSVSTNPIDLGRSVPVPNVQELAATTSAGNGLEIPVRYIRPEAAADPVYSAAGEEDELPVIDLAKLMDPEVFDEEVARLGFACRDWGFFQLVNHGVQEELTSKMMEDIMEFFNLPLKEKEQIKQLPGQIEGYGQLFVQSEEQKLDWADMLVLAIYPPERRDLRFWPASPTTFRDTLFKYTSKIMKVAGSLFRFMAKDLGVDPEAVVNLLSNQIQSVRINYYPPCKEPSKVLGLSSHSDGTGLTVVLQGNDVHGLQIMKDDKWFPVKPRPGALIVNIGDLIEIMSNGKYRSIEHRVVIDREKPRLSIATFHAPELSITVRPFSELVLEEGERYRNVTVGEFMKVYMTEKLDGRSLLEKFKLKK